MDPQTFSLNSEAEYRPGAVYPVDGNSKAINSFAISNESLTEPEIVVRAVASGDDSGSWDAPTSFKTTFPNVFDKYRLPLVKSDDLIKTWSSNPMDWWQNQLNFAVWCATTGCGVSVQDHLNASNPLQRSIYRFHVYYQIRRILEEIKAPLPKDQAWSATQNPYDGREFERVSNEFGVSPGANWKVRGPNGGLGRVYFFAGGRYLPLYGVGDPDHYDPATMSFKHRTGLHGWLHIDFIKQDAPGAAQAWRQLVLDKSQGFTKAGGVRLNDSIRTYTWALLGSQVKSRSVILGNGSTSLEAQEEFLALVEAAINRPVDKGDDVDNYEDTLQHARSELNFAIGYGLILCPADMLMRIGRGIAGYNNNIVVAEPGKVSLLLNPGLNAGIQPPAEPDDHPLQDTDPSEPEPGPISSQEVTANQTPSEPASSQISSYEVTTNQHEDEKTALVISGVAAGLIGLWVISRN